MRRLTLALVAVVCALVATTVASGASNVTTLRLTAPASGALKFNTKLLRAKAGKVTIILKNLGPLPHDIAIKGPGIAPKKGKIVGKGLTSTVVAVLKKGRYTFFCSVPGHEAAGMKGTLIVS
jgi:plastocyanin